MENSMEVPQKPTSSVAIWSSNLSPGHIPKENYSLKKCKHPYVHWRRQWHPTPVLLPGKSHGQRSLVGCSPWGRKELDTTERLHFHFSLSCIGEGNGNPLQCSCLENPRDGGAWWASVCGVAQSRTWLKRLSSSSSKLPKKNLTEESKTTLWIYLRATWKFHKFSVL